jgi:hypothetical protein
LKPIWLHSCSSKTTAAECAKETFSINLNLKTMAKNSTHEAAIPNPALSFFSVLVGEWKTIGTHPYVPGTIFHGHTSFNWIEGGAFLIMHSEIDEPEIPGGIAIFGSDDASKEYFMLYFDERKVSRKYDVSFSNNELKWWRISPEFSQKFTWTITDGGNTITSKGELSKDGKPWEKDLELTLTRIKNS